MFRDTELPAGFQDDDFDMRDLEAAGAAVARAKRQGKCAHGWRQGSMPDNGIKKDHAKCLHCGKVAPESELDAEWNEIVHG